MTENFSTLEKGDIVYVLSLKDFTYKKSVVVANDESGVFTQYKDFTKAKFGGKLYYQAIKEDDTYSTISEQELRNELVFLRDRNQNFLNDTGFMINFMKKHHMDMEDNDKELSDYENSYAKAKSNIEKITETLNSL